MKTKQVVSKPIRPNAAIEELYDRKLQNLIRQMHKSVMYYVRAVYNENKSEIVTDANPVISITRRIKKLTRYWQNRFNEKAEQLAFSFMKKTQEYNQFSFKKATKDAGFTIDFNPSEELMNVMRAKVEENVQLIKSIPNKYLSEVNETVMRAVSTGGEWGGVQEALQERYKITSRRANLIVRDQSSKATSAFNRQRQLDNGITRAIWVHSGGGKHPRKSHVKAGREKLEYDVEKGALIDGKYIFPGQEINCGCTSRIVLTFPSEEK